MAATDLYTNYAVKLSLSVVLLPHLMRYNNSSD